MIRGWLFVAALLLALGTHSLLACCAVSKSGSAVVNADQTVLIIWNPQTKMQHFVRQANFKSDTKDIGFLVPSPTKPVLADADNKVFEKLKFLTKPEIKQVKRDKGLNGFGGGFGGSGGVEVIEQKRVAGYDATILKADSAEALLNWLKENDYHYSPAVSEWAKPYLADKWFFTALKVAPKDAAKPGNVTLQAPALRISFTTDKPLFPYREPTTDSLPALGVKSRTLRTFFLSDQRYTGELGDGQLWTGKTVWANQLAPAQIKNILDHLKLPFKEAPPKAWLTEFEDDWAYNTVKSDLHFVPDAKNEKLARLPKEVYID
jgi:hypothetical protein